MAFAFGVASLLLWFLFFPAALAIWLGVAARRQPGLKERSRRAWHLASLGMWFGIFSLAGAAVDAGTSNGRFYALLIAGLALVLPAATAGVLLLAINPLQKAADKLADKAMPNVADTPAYASFRKLEVYKAAVEELAVGGVTEKERRALDALRAKLGIALSDAKAMERNIVSALVA